MPNITVPPSYFFAIHPHCCLRFCGGVFLALAWLAVSEAQAQTTTYALGTTNLLVGPAARTNSVVLAVSPASGVWTATTNAAWLHLSPAYQSGTGSTNVVFSYDANPGPTRAGTLTIAGLTLTVTQAGSTYVAVGSTPIQVISGVGELIEVAVDGVGNVYCGEANSGAIGRWTSSNNTFITLFSPELTYPYAGAVDSAGDVYIVETSFIKEWTAAISNVTTLASSFLGDPRGAAVDGAGNIYIAYYDDGAIGKWTAANSNVTALVSSGLNQPQGVAVDGGGNVYIADSLNKAIKKWTVANSNVTTIFQGTSAEVTDVAVDGTGNVYINESTSIEELDYAFMDPTPRLEIAVAGGDELPVVLPSTANLIGPFTPTSDQPWLTITGITNGVVSFSFVDNTGPSRTAQMADPFLSRKRPLPLISASP